MNDLIYMEPLSPKMFDKYIQVGTKAYNEHYTHLWANADTSPYVQESFTHAVLKEEHSDANTQFFLIKKHGIYVGIVKLIIDCAIDGYSKKEALYLDKIYIIKEAVGQGIGTKTLEFILLRAKEANKKLVWLATMQKGPALNFYKQHGFYVHSTTEVKFEHVLDEEKPMFIMKKKIL